MSGWVREMEREAEERAEREQKRDQVIEAMTKWLEGYNPYTRNLDWSNGAVAGAEAAIEHLKALLTGAGSR